jgi:hypothetical protein
MAANAIQLQGIGLVEAIPASEVEPGMSVMYNYGSTYEVLSVEPTGKKSLTFQMRDPKTGKVYDERKVRTTVMAAYWPRTK